MNNAPAESFLARAAGACARRPWTVVLAGVALAAAGAVAGATCLSMRTGRNEMFGKDDPALVRFRRFTDRFAGDRQLLAVFRVDGDPARAASAVARFEALAQGLVGTELEAVFARPERERLAVSAPFLMPAEDLAALERTLERESPVLHRWARACALEDRLGAIAEAVGRDAGTLADRDLARVEPLFDLGRCVENALGGGPVAPWPTPDLVDPLAELLPTPDRALVLVHLLPSVRSEDSAWSTHVVRTVRERIALVVGEHPGLAAGLTGQEAIDADEMDVSQADMTLASVLAYAGVVVLITLCYRGIVRPAAVSFVLVVAVGWTFGVAVIHPGHLNLLSIVFALILIGLGADYGTYLFSAYEASRRAGHDAADAVEVAARASGSAILAGAAATAIAFYSAMLVDFEGMNELGFLAGTGVALSAIAMLTVLPALFAIIDRRAPAPQTPSSIASTLGSLATLATAWIPAPSLRRDRVVLAVVLAATVAFAARLPALEFSYNPRLLLAPGLESVEYESLVRSHSREATWFCVVHAPDRAALSAKLAPLAALPTVRSTRSILDVRPLPDPDREAAARRIAALVPPRGDPARHRPPDRAAVRGALQAIADGLLDASSGLLQARPELAGRLAGLSERFDGAARAVGALNPDAAQDALLLLDHAMCAGIDRRLAALAPLAAPRILADDELPPLFRTLFVARDGTGYAGYVFPEHDIADDRHLEELLAHARAIDPEITGLPDMFLAGSRAIRHGFERISLFTLIAVLGILACTFRSFRASVLALVPLIVGVVWTFSAMTWMGWPLDLANCFGVPILLGIGIDVGIHLVHADHARHTDPARWGTTLKAVIVNVLTTVIGFAAMLIARHKGLAGLGGFVSLGMCACLVAGLGVLPACLRLFGRSSERAVP